jgi:hypothetical protein
MRTIPSEIRETAATAAQKARNLPSEARLRVARAIKRPSRRGRTR